MLPFKGIEIDPMTIKLGLNVDILRKNKPFIIVVGDVKTKMYDLSEHGGETVVRSRED